MAKRFLTQFFARSPRNEGKQDDPPDDRDAGIPVRVRRGPPDRGSVVAVAEPDDD
ncbi:MAG TPA: hypothetical protein VKN18_00520 [Blastocatellia bacterium]|nr:hypothetical protein [Blastocatellia bacterium]